MSTRRVARPSDKQNEESSLMTCLRYLYRLLIVGLLVSGLGLAPALVVAQQDTEQDTEEEALREAFTVAFNTLLREEYDALPLARHPALDELAQDIAIEVGCADEEVQFDIPEDVVALGYTPYADEARARTTRVPLLPIVNQRSIASIVELYAPSIYESNINQPGRFYREMGVGISICSESAYSIFVILGAQPDVIPVVIDNGAAQLMVETVPHEVRLFVHQENSRPLDGIFGTTEQMRLSNEPLTVRDFAQRYRESLTWTLDTCGENTVYYELIDADEQRVSGETRVELICENPPAEDETDE